MYLTHPLHKALHERPQRAAVVFGERCHRFAQLRQAHPPPGVAAT